MAGTYLRRLPYQPPKWAEMLPLAPNHKISLGMLPTPLHHFKPPNVPSNVEMYIKRDDLTGLQLSGNKVRKLEFLMSEAIDRGHDSIITIGGVQSNHARATAVAARLLGLECHLILRNGRMLAESDPGLVGNIMVDRLAGATIHQVTKEEYQKVGSKALVEQLAKQLQGTELNPYCIAVGGSTPLGTWGYVAAAEELLEQTAGRKFTDVVLACGSGGTAAGMALGCHLSGSGLRVHAYGVCDTPDMFYDDIDALFKGMGATPDLVGGTARDMLTVIQAKGAGYAMSSEDELKTVVDTSQATGIICDPVYSGKALHQMVKDMAADRDEWAGRKVIFLHTGGLLGIYEKTDQLLPLIKGLGKANRMHVQGIWPAE